MKYNNIKELKIFYSDKKDNYFNAELSFGDGVIIVKSNNITVIYPTCNVAKIIFGEAVKVD